MHKWYHNLVTIQGLFSYQTWNGMDGFWQNGIAIESMVNAMVYGNHSRYYSVLKVLIMLPHCISSANNHDIPNCK